jgi:hypothetical protein
LGEIKWTNSIAARLVSTFGLKYGAKHREASLDPSLWKQLEYPTSTLANPLSSNYNTPRTTMMNHRQVPSYVLESERKQSSRSPRALGW